MEQSGASPNVPSKPEGLPEQFWDGETGSVKFDDLGKSYNELSAFQAEQQSRLAAVPESPDGYELKLPSDIKMPDGYTFALDANDPMVALGRETAKQAGLDQAGFEKLVGSYAEFQAKQTADIAAAEAAQIKALGPQGKQRADAAKTWLVAKFGPEAPSFFEVPLKTKAGVEYLERMMRMTTAGGAPGFTPTGREVGQKSNIEGWSEMSAGEMFLAARRS